MYQIFFHIASITILEICFFFYYVGPLETRIFLSYIKRILNGPMANLDAALAQWHISKEDFINGLYLENQNAADLEHSLYKDSLEGRRSRQKDNEILFFHTLEYWTAICGAGILFFFLQLCYQRFRQNKTSKNVVTLTSDQSLNSLEMQVYRKDSIDSDSDETDILYNNHIQVRKIDQNQEDTENNSLDAKKKWLFLLTTLHYIIYGGSIITFQYLFFKYIVFEYKPLSIGEIKYFVYSELLKD